MPKDVPSQEWSERTHPSYQSLTEHVEKNYKFLDLWQSLQAKHTNSMAKDKNLTHLNKIHLLINQRFLLSQEWELLKTKTNNKKKSKQRYQRLHMTKRNKFQKISLVNSLNTETNDQAKMTNISSPGWSVTSVTTIYSLECPLFSRIYKTYKNTESATHTVFFKLIIKLLLRRPTDLIDLINND